MQAAEHNCQAVDVGVETAKQLLRDLESGEAGKAARALLASERRRKNQSRISVVHSNHWDENNGLYYLGPEGFEREDSQFKSHKTTADDVIAHGGDPIVIAKRLTSQLDAIYRRVEKRTQRGNSYSIPAIFCCGGLVEIGAWFLISPPLTKYVIFCYS